MSFKPGDVVVVIQFPETCFGTEYIGREGSVIGPCFSDPTCTMVDFGDGARPAGTEILRLKRPPTDEFQPAEPEFVSDLLKRLNKVKA